MLESDADRLASIKALGGVAASTAGGSLWGIFDRTYQAAQMTGIDIEDRAPVFECRSADVDRMAIVKDVTLTICGVDYRVKRLEPDGTGMTIVVLRS